MCVQTDTHAQGRRDKNKMLEEAVMYGGTVSGPWALIWARRLWR